MANALNKIYKDYIDFHFESSCSTTPEFASFARKFKAALKKDAEMAGLKLVKFTRGHFYVSAYVLNPLTNRHVTFSIERQKMRTIATAGIITLRICRI